MSFSLNFPLFMIVASLFLSVVSSLLNGKTARILHLTLSGVSTVLNAIILVYVLKTDSSYTYMMGHFPHPWGNESKIGIFEAIFATLFTGVLFLTILGGKQSIEEYVNEDKRNLYYSLCNLIEASLLVLTYTNDIFTGYVFVEICTLASVGILMIRSNGRTTAASMRYIIFSLIGSGLLLFGIVFMYNITGNLLFPSLNENITELWSNGTYRIPLLAAMCFIAIGLCIKSGLFPFHFWMADTYGTAIPAASGILSGIISKGYIVFLLKCIFDVFGTGVFKQSGIPDIIFVMGILGVIIGSVSARRENNIFRMLAYSSTAQIAYIYMGIGICNKEALIASCFQIIAHAITKPALFLSAYRLSNVSDGAKKFKNLEESASRDLFAAVCFVEGGLSLIGIPLTAGFISKFLFGLSSFESNGIKLVITLIALVASTILNTTYFTHTFIRIYTNKNTDNKEYPKKKEYLISGSVFIVLNILLGTIGNSVIEILQKIIAM